MARFEAEIPYDLIDLIKRLGNGKAEEMIDEMLLEAGNYVYDEITKNAEKVFNHSDDIVEHLQLALPYKTKDGAKNVFVGFTGELPSGVPVALVTIAREYGTSSGEKKKPFVRPAFNKRKIEKIMSEVEEKYLPKED